jgi:hypothetical protein
LNSKAGPVESISAGVPSDAAEDVELVMMKVDRHGIVGLIRRPLRAQAGDAEQHEHETEPVESKCRGKASTLLDR